MRLARVTTPSARRLTRRPALALVIGGLLIGAWAMAAGCGRGSKPATAGVRGRVVSANGRALAGATLFAWPLGGARVGVVEAARGPDGRFALGGLAPGPWTLMVEAPGFATLRLERVDVPGRPLVLRLEGEARTLGGLVIG